MMQLVDILIQINCDYAFALSFHSHPFAGGGKKRDFWCIPFLVVDILSSANSNVLRS